MTPETLDTLEGVLYTAVFLVLVFAGSRVMLAVNKRRYNHAFLPLVPLIGGTLQSEGNAAMMTGAFEDRRVLADANYDVRSSEFPGDPNAKRNILRIEMSSVEGATDWVIGYRSEYFSRPEWSAFTEDDALRDALVAAGAVAEVNGMGIDAFVRFSSGRKTLTYEEDIRPRMAPSVQRFGVQLACLSRLAAINARVNV